MAQSLVPEAKNGTKKKYNKISTGYINRKLKWVRKNLKNNKKVQIGGED